MYLKRDTGLGGWITVPAVADVLKYSCIVCWSSREKNNVEQDLKEKEDTIKQRTSEVQVNKTQNYFSVTWYCTMWCFNGSGITESLDHITHSVKRKKLVARKKNVLWSVFSIRMWVGVGVCIYINVPSPRICSLHGVLNEKYYKRIGFFLFFLFCFVLVFSKAIWCIIKTREDTVALQIINLSGWIKRACIWGCFLRVAVITSLGRILPQVNFA